MTDRKGRKPILCLDFDGVCHSYTSGWKGADQIPDAPVAGMWEAIGSYLPEFEVYVFSSRSHQPGGLEAMRAWFIESYWKWWNEGCLGGPCLHPIGNTTCGYSRAECMHEGSPSPIVPVNGRHTYVPCKQAHPEIDMERAREIVNDSLHFPLEKPPAWVSLDDRTVQFIGVWPDVGYLRNFKPWYQRGEKAGSV